MGHTINPISNRLRINCFWKSTWCSYTKLNYKYLVLCDLNFYKFLNWFLKLPFFKKTVLTVANISIHYSNFKCTVFIDYIPLKYKLFKLIGKKLLRQHHKEKIIRKHILPKYYVPVRQKIRKKYIQKGKQKRGGRILGYKIRNKTWTFYKNPNIEETPFVMESMLKIEEFLESFANLSIYILLLFLSY